MKTFWDEFLTIARRYPDHVAIRDNGREMTYAALAARAARIGTMLFSKGVGPEMPVGLCIEKSAEYVAALLGVWHAGAAFVPLPPSLPRERHDYIVAEAGIQHILTAENVRQAAGASAAPCPVTPGTLAYLIYTSGSTGKPKGVMVEHRGVVNLCTAQREAFNMRAGSRSLFYLSTSFDASISDIGVALLTGATLVIRPQEELQDGAALQRLLREESITHMDIPPSLLKVMNPADMPQSLETVIIGGEAADPEAVRSWAEKFRIVNVYGPTESTVCTSMNLCGPDWDRPLLGQPLPGVTYSLMDGELYIGGKMLARGYLNQPELTAQKFITRKGKRLYRTGDRVMQHPDGSFEFLGRLDRQFKLRGQLVEPDEIESRLRAHPQVMKAAVTKRGGRIVAFVALSDAGVVSGLAAWVAKTLPAWMVPQHFEVIARLPLTASGKTDYAALAQMPLQDQTRPRIAPRNDAEQRLWNIWRAVLKHGDFGVTDGFYAVGGDSLGIIRLTLEAERQGFPASVSLLAKFPTIEEQVKHAGSHHNALSAEWLRQDVAFSQDDRIMIAAVTQRPVLEETANILLTGATGFLGSRVLSELLEQTEVKIYCIVRAADAADALQRIEDAIDKFNVSVSRRNRERIIAIPGDLSQAGAGLDARMWDFLADNMSAIYHCAACVNMVLPYADMRAVNVGGALTMLKLACTGRRKALHNASTLSVFVATDRNSGTLLESDDLSGVTTVYGGYAQTKFAAEHMLSNVPAESCDITQYRFGLLTGDTKTGASSPTDFLAMFAKGISQLGAIPEGAAETLKVDITPICHAARAMVHLSLQANPGVYHIAGSEGLTLARFCTALEEAGKPVRQLPVTRWLDLAKSKPLTPEESAAVLSLCRVLPGDDRFEQLRTMDLFQATNVAFDMREADTVLRPAGIACPEATEELLGTYLSWFFRHEKPLVKICLFGPESTGKSTLAKKLVQHFGAPLAPEYAHEHIVAHGGKIESSDIPLIAAGQIRAETGAAARAEGLLVCDTDLLTTVIWSERLFGQCPGWVRDAASLQRYDLYLLMDIDAPWVADVHRYLPQERESFLNTCRATLETHERPYTTLSGTWDDKFNAACIAIEGLQGKIQEKAA
ncbi:MAG: amino acid adenylation domain-containing protein [Alphaproteobacteria bacterium]